jgi:hypothetical protein
VVLIYPDGRLGHRRVLQKHGLDLKGADPIPEKKPEG